MFGAQDYRQELTAPGTYTIIPSADVPPGMRVFVQKVEATIDDLPAGHQILVQEIGGGKIHFETEAATGEPDVESDGFGSKNSASGTGLEIVISGPGPGVDVTMYVSFNLQPDA